MMGERRWAVCEWRQDVKKIGMVLIGAGKEEDWSVRRCLGGDDALAGEDDLAGKSDCQR